MLLFFFCSKASSLSLSTPQHAFMSVINILLASLIRTTLLLYTVLLVKLQCSAIYSQRKYFNKNKQTKDKNFTATASDKPERNNLQFTSKPLHNDNLSKQMLIKPQPLNTRYHQLLTLIEITELQSPCQHVHRMMY